MLDPDEILRSFASGREVHTSTVTTKVQKALTLHELMKAVDELKQAERAACPFARVMDSVGMPPEQGYVMFLPFAYLDHADQFPKYVRVDRIGVIPSPVVMKDPFQEIQELKW